MIHGWIICFFQIESSFEEHLLICDNCRNIVDEYRKLSRTTKKLYSAVNIPESNIYKLEQPVALKYRSYVFNRYTALAAAVLLAFVYTLISVSDNDSENLKGNMFWQRVGVATTEIDYSEWNLQINLIEQEIQFVKEQLPKIN